MAGKVSDFCKQLIGVFEEDAGAAAAWCRKMGIDGGSEPRAAASRGLWDRYDLFSEDDDKAAGMPADVEWPLYVDGYPVRIGDLIPHEGREAEVYNISFFEPKKNEKDPTKRRGCTMALRGEGVGNIHLGLRMWQRIPCFPAEEE